MNSNAIVPLNADQSIAGVKMLANIVHALYEDVFKPGLDYGVIPGTGTKPVLLLPGMEKLMRALQLRPEYIPRQTVIDFDKPLFFFQYECRLVEIDTGMVVGAAIGSANSHESKWRWRNAERICPACGKATIIKGKAEYGGGWLCFAKKGGCGAKFAEADPSIADQSVGRVENPDIADQLNTIDKIAQKRALASAIKGAANVSELFTVDIDDLVDYVVANGQPAPAPAPELSAPRMTKDDARQLAKDWAASDGLTSADIRVALGGGWQDYDGDFDTANARIKAWVAEQAEPVASGENS
jgi:hypothetical protein